jgi:hypothetical protein
MECAELCIPEIAVKLEGISAFCAAGQPNE